MVEGNMQSGIVGGRKTIGTAIQFLVQQTAAAELNFWLEAYSYTDRICSYAILAESVESPNV